MVNQVPVNTIEITEKAANKVKIFAEKDGLAFVIEFL